MLEHSSVIRPCLGERVSGDAVVIQPLEGGIFAAIVGSGLKPLKDDWLR